MSDKKVQDVPKQTEEQVEETKESEKKEVCRPPIVCCSLGQALTVPNRVTSVDGEEEKEFE